MINTTDPSVAGEVTGNSCPEVAQNCPLQHSHKIGQRVRIAMFLGVGGLGKINLILQKQTLMHARIIRLAGILISEKSGSVMVEHKACIASVSVQKCTSQYAEVCGPQIEQFNLEVLSMILSGFFTKEKLTRPAKMFLLICILSLVVVPLLVLIFSILPPLMKINTYLRQLKSFWGHWKHNMVIHILL